MSKSSNIKIVTKVVKVPKSLKPLIPGRDEYAFKVLNGEPRCRWKSWPTKDEAEEARDNWIVACRQRENALVKADPTGHHFILVFDRRNENGEVERFFRTEQEIAALTAISNVEIRSDF